MSSIPRGLEIICSVFTNLLMKYEDVTVVQCVASLRVNHAGPCRVPDLATSSQPNQIIKVDRWVSLVSAGYNR